MSAGYGPPVDQGEMIQLRGSFRNEEQRHEYEIFFRRSTRLLAEGQVGAEHVAIPRFDRRASMT
jgi:hypothetical protein